MKKYVIISMLFVGMIVTVFAISTHPDNPDSKIKIFNQSIAYESEMNYKKALETMVSSYEDNKNDYLFNLRLGWLYYLNEKYDSSIKYYTNSKKIKQSAIEPMLGLTLPLAAQDKWDEVKKQYEAVLGADPKNFTANLRLGQIYLNGTDYQNAKKYLEVVHNLYPAEYEPNLSLGWTYYYLGNKSKAKELLTNALMLSPNDKLAKEGLELLK
jgi:tetratricopeptide (TPR) repeat protein